MKNSTANPEDILLALDQLAQTIEVMGNIISRLKFIVETPPPTSVPDTSSQIIDAVAITKVH